MVEPKTYPMANPIDTHEYPINRLAERAHGARRPANGTQPAHRVGARQSGHEIGIVFETATPFDTPREMEDLIAWTRKTSDEEALHPLLIAAVIVTNTGRISPAAAAEANAVKASRLGYSVPQRP